MKFELEEYNRNVDQRNLLEDLKRVVAILKKKRITAREYQSLGKYSLTPFLRVFGSWSSALEQAGLDKTKTQGISIEEYFKNIEEIWSKLGRQPKYADIQKPLSRYSIGAYEYRFGTWYNALRAFTKYINEDKNEIFKNGKPFDKEVVIRIQGNKHKTNRNINWRLRFIIMKRDNFKCKNCGRSPATDPSIVLHVGHVKAWANGGETVLENLQTLCSKCNIGKSDLE